MSRFRKKLLILKKIIYYGRTTDNRQQTTDFVHFKMQRYDVAKEFEHNGTRCSCKALL